MGSYLSLGFLKGEKQFPFFWGSERKGSILKCNYNIGYKFSHCCRTPKPRLSQVSVAYVGRSGPARPSWTLRFAPRTQGGCSGSQCHLYVLAQERRRGQGVTLLFVFISAAGQPGRERGGCVPLK